MISIRLITLVIAAMAASSVQAGRLVSRQLAPAIPNVPVPCQPVCIVFTTLQQSLSPQQLCTAANVANIQRCAQCIMTMNTSSVVGNDDLMNQLQTAVNSFTGACAAAALPVPPITLVNPLTQQPLLGGGTLPTPGQPLTGFTPQPIGTTPQPGVPGVPGTTTPIDTAPPSAVEVRKDVTVRGAYNIPSTPTPLGQTTTPIPGQPVQSVPGAQTLPGAQTIPGAQTLQPATQLLQQTPGLTPQAVQPPAGIPGIQSFNHVTRVKRSLPNNPIALLRRLESSTSTSTSSSKAPSSTDSTNSARVRMDSKSLVGLTVAGLLISWLL